MNATSRTVILPTPDLSAALISEINGAAPNAGDPIEQLLRRAEAHGTKRARLVAVRIRHDLDLLEQLLAQSGEEAAARRKVEKLRARLAEAEAELAQKTGAPTRNIARIAGSNHPAPEATTKVMREWLIEHGHPVSDRGRLCRADIDLYEAAHARGGS